MEDNDQILAEELLQEETDSAEEKRQEAFEKVCMNGIKKMSASVFWLVIMVLGVLLAAVGIYLDPVHSFKPNVWDWKTWSSVSTGVGLVLLALTRMLGNSKVMKPLAYDRKVCLSSGLPDESDSFIRGVYLYYCRRRCSHFWLSFGIGCMFMIIILYTLVAVGIEAIVNKGSTPTLKLISKPSFKTPALSHQFIAIGLMGVLITFLQYHLFKGSYTRIIKAFEQRYGREKIVDECQYWHHMSRINFRYKSFAFIIVCLIGCLFYLLLKRLICIIFDKSFCY